MAAMTEDQELQVLEELKNYLDITWDDPKGEKKLLGMIRRGMAAISGKVGECDFLGETQEKALLFQLVMYEYSGEQQQFWVNYKSELIGLQVAKKVERYAETAEETI